MSLIGWLPPVALLACCHGGPDAPRPTAARAAAPDAAAPPAPACSPPAVAELASYEDVRVPDTYWLEMVRETHGWAPARRLRMPLHHATRIDLVNVAEVPLLGSGGPDRARVTIEITKRDIQHDPDRNTWFVTYHARIVDACAAPPP